MTTVQYFFRSICKKTDNKNDIMSSYRRIIDFPSWIEIIYDNIQRKMDEYGKSETGNIIRTKETILLSKLNAEIILYDVFR